MTQARQVPRFYEYTGIHHASLHILQGRVSLTKRGGSHRGYCSSVSFNEGGGGGRLSSCTKGSHTFFVFPSSSGFVFPLSSGFFSPPEAEDPDEDEPSSAAPQTGVKDDPEYREENIAVIPSGPTAGGSGGAEVSLPSPPERPAVAGA